MTDILTDILEETEDEYFEKVYIQLDNDGFCEHWVDCYFDGAIECDVEGNIEMLENIQKYRYDANLKTFVYDDSKLIQVAKEIESFELESTFKEAIADAVAFEINGKTFYCFNDNTSLNLVLVSYIYLTNNPTEIVNLRMLDEAGFEVVLQSNLDILKVIIEAITKSYSDKLSIFVDLTNSIRSSTTIEDIDKVDKDVL